MSEPVQRYKYVYVDGKKVLEHVYVWEQANGPKPKGCDIHHKDGDGMNNALENLECLTKSEHKMLHAKAKLEGKDIVDGTDPVIIRSRERNNACTKAHRKTHLEQERARDRAEYQQNREHKLELQHEAYQRNRESIRASQARYEETHKEERATRNAEYYAQHAEERKQYLREYRQKHKAEVAAKKREYYDSHQEQIKAHRELRKPVHAALERIRRAVKRGATEEEIAPLRENLAKAKETLKLQMEKK